ncbi:hypothetical protein [Bartonella taylorii]|uniref:hypothetical protein n=1 Tax=Bartonella taylorii TaxID=33046 RepID=UPI001ABBD3F4|nr:hypothetical protein [Bartonella taylorii]
MSKISELNKLKKRIKYANSHLNTTLGIETMNKFVPSVPVPVKNIRKITRELKKWQAEKKFKQKKENFAVRAYKYNELIPNNAFHFNAYPETKKQLYHYDKYLKKLKRNIIKKDESDKIVLSKNFFKAKDEVVSDMLKRHFIKKKDLLRKYDTLPTPVMKSLSELTRATFNIKAIKDKRNFFSKADLKGFNVKYHQNFIKAAQVANLPELEKWIKKQGQYMSYYLYLQGFTIADFYLNYMIGVDRKELISSTIENLKTIINEKSHVSLKIDQKEHATAIRYHLLAPSKHPATCKKTTAPKRLRWNHFISSRRSQTVL